MPRARKTKPKKRARPAPPSPKARKRPAPPPKRRKKSSAPKKLPKRKKSAPRHPRPPTPRFVGLGEALARGAAVVAEFFRERAKNRPPRPKPPEVEFSAGFVPYREPVLQLARRRAERLREIPGKPDLVQIRVDERGFVVAVDEATGEPYRAYTVTGPRGDRRLYWARENALEGYEAPRDFLDRYRRTNDDGEEVFGNAEYEAEFDFAEEVSHERG